MLEGPFAHAYSDSDDDPLTAGEEIQKTGGGFVFPFQAFGGPGCDATALCSWDRSIPHSWKDNRKQNGVQAFYLVNRFRDHLANDPDIAFDGFRDADPVLVETDDGASTDPGGPDNEHLNNASMATLPEGISPRMELFLFDGNGFRTVNGGDSAAIVWHEYTHGLSNRLVVHDEGTGALSSPQAGAMGEGWSDWYALDLLVGDGLMDDTPAPGDVDVGHYVDADPHSVRTQGIDCPVGVADPRCPGGGYTYGEFAQIAGGPEVHADGEIWAQTLWDLREAVGPDVAQSLITEGMRMAPPEPSFLDMRNAILAADAGLGGASRNAVWQVFAERGMGYRAYSDGADDVAPDPDFSLPPGGAHSVATGTVTSAESGLSLGNASVGLASLTGDAAFPDRLETVTAANGSYALGAPAGTYGALTVELPGYDTVSLPGFAVPGVRDVALRRDWAASAGGGFVFRNDPPYDDSGAPFGCGLAKLIDQRSTSGWSAVKSGAPQALVRLPAAIDVSGFGLDPTNTCGDPAGASTRDFRIETSSDGSSFTTAVAGRFSSAHRGSLHHLPADVRNVRYVRLTLALAAGGEQRLRRHVRADRLRRTAEHAAVRLAGGQPRGPAHGWHGRLRGLLHRPRLAHRRLRLGLRRRRVRRSLDGRGHDLVHVHAGRRLRARRGGPRLPRRGRHGDPPDHRHCDAQAGREAAAARAPREGDRAREVRRALHRDRAHPRRRPHRAHGAAHADDHRRAADRAVAAAQGAPPPAQRAGTAHGQRALRRRAVDDRPPHGAHRALAHANSAAQVRLPTLPSTGRAHGGPWRRRWKVLTIRSVFSA